MSTFFLIFHVLIFVFFVGNVVGGFDVGDEKPHLTQNISPKPAVNLTNLYLLLFLVLLELKGYLVCTFVVGNGDILVRKVEAALRAGGVLGEIE